MSKVSELLSKETAGLPNWAWLLIIAAGIGAAVLVPKLLPGQGQNSSDNSSTDSGSGLGLAIDPTTGLPYAVEGLVPAGASLPVNGTTTTGTTTGTTTTGTTGVVRDGGGSGTVPMHPIDQQTQQNQSSTPARYVHPASWPNPTGSLSGLAAANGISLQRIEDLNPWIKQQRGSFDLIYTTDNIRVA